MCDVEVVVDSGERFPAHKIVLAAGSDYFRALFTSGMRESSQATEVTVSEVEASAMSDVLTFMYEAQLSVTSASLVATMRAASRLEVGLLLKLSAEFLATTLTPETLVTSWAVMQTIGRPEMEPLRAACEELAARKFLALTFSADFNELSMAQLQAVLARDDVGAPEEAIFGAVRQWLNAQKPAVDDAARLALYELVRYPFMEPSYLGGTVETELRRLDGGQALLFEAYRHKSMPTSLQHPSPRTKPRLAVLPRGVQLDLPADFLCRWTCHFEHGYSHHTTVTEIETVPAHATHVFVGARRPDGTIALGACGRRDEVLRHTRDDEEEGHEDNGVYWYFAFEENEGSNADESGYAFGFSRVPAIRLSAADIMGSPNVASGSDEDGKYRLSWHTSGDEAGWRAGTLIDLDDRRWKKLLYWIVF